MNIIDLATNTSKWSLVFHKVSQTTVQLWAGTLFGTLAQPKLARLIVSQNGTEVDRQDISQKQWQRPGFYSTRTFFLLLQISPNSRGSLSVRLGWGSKYFARS